MHIYKAKNNVFFEDNNFVLLNGDCFELIKTIKSRSVNVIFADPPYFLSGGGVTCKSGKMVFVDKAQWDKKKVIDEKLKYNKKWIKLCKRILKDNGTIWISGTFHNIYTIGVALEKEGFSIINNITWQKLSPPPNLACKAFTHSTETILWACKSGSKYFYNYALMKKLNGNRQKKDVWNDIHIKKLEKEFGKHPTQKPLDLLKRIILASTKENDIVLDPFNGSGTTGIACSLLKRQYIGIDSEKEYLEISKKRYLNIKERE